MHNALRVHVVDRLENLLDEVGRVAFCVAALLDDAVEELAAVDAAQVRRRLVFAELEWARARDSLAWLAGAAHAEI